MKCYMIVLGAFTDFERFMSGYQQVVGPMVERLGGRYVLMGAGTHVLEGSWHDGGGAVISEWPDRAAALERLRRWLIERPADATPKVAVTARDLKGAFAVFLLVFLSTFPVVLPFVFIADPGVAKRVSAAVAIAMLFACGYAWGRYAGLKAWRTGLVMVLLGLAVEVVVIALGG